MVKLPSGRLVRTLFGGEGALKTAVGYLETGTIDGLVKSSFSRDGGPSIGYLVTRKGKAYLAIHESDRELYGEEALYEVARDSMHDDCIIEVRSYSYKSSSVSVNHLGETNPDALFGHEPDTGTVLEIVADEEKERIESERKELAEKRMRDDALRHADKDLRVRSEDLDEARLEALTRIEDFERMKNELDSVRMGSVALLKQLTADKKGLSEEDVLELADRR